MPFIPSSVDVQTVRSILASRGLPAELVLEILDYARYWVPYTNEYTVGCKMADEEWSLDFSQARLYNWARLPPVDPIACEYRHLREIEFVIVSHDQGWTTENTAGTYNTSSWFETSIIRRNDPEHIICSVTTFPSINDKFRNLEEVQAYLVPFGWTLVSRPSVDVEPQRRHCPEMMKVESGSHPFSEVDEGKYAWYLQGNQVARGYSVFHGELVRRYRVVWGCSSNLNFEGNEGAGRGEGFVDSLEEGDILAIFARAKRRGWENNILGVQMKLWYTI
ncbi:hypothetical protein K469DRAFT_633387 [Zopfia rhizophila CBS 207.26]|uniref:Uncharacterized protein n=1 Tax=Zopfia rhizophila CBS 207.26 TaxID=1314779 RepID=A0A6A6E269_9PEZI|nr:hypothetical protein K469DRAFT_633387 [Zopfia rhizophila CBS 207.26]